MKVFISQPMGNKSTMEIRRERARLIELLSSVYPEDETDILGSFFLDEKEEKHPGLLYLADSLTLLDEADVAFFAKDFRNARGCLIEYEVAKKYGVKILLEEDLVKE